MEIQKPDYYKKKINELDQQYNQVIYQLSISQPMYFSNKSNNGYKVLYEDDLKKITQVQSNFKDLLDNLQDNIITLSAEIEKGDIYVKDILKNNNNLSKKKTGLENMTEAAEGSLQDKQLIYNQKLLSNLFVGIGIIGLSFFYYTKENIQS
jgi:alpha-glucosidase (family GH31 glycosyl hydrolase)